MNSSHNAFGSSLPVAVVLFGVAGLAWFGWNAVSPQRGARDEQARPRVVDARGDLASDERTQIELFRAASPSVAHITTRAVAVDRFLMRATEVPSGTGSGFVWDDRGYVVTNYHVVANARRAFVTLN